MATKKLTTLRVNGEIHQLELDPDTPLLYVLRNDLELKGAKYGCGTELCGACKVLIDGSDVPTCQLPIEHVEDLEITTLEGLSDTDDLHPLQETFLEERAAQCGFCTAGMIIAAQGMLNRVRYPADDDIRAALSNNLCRCGVYDRVRRAIKLRIGRFEPPIYEIIEGAPIVDFVIGPAVSPSLESHPQIDDWIQLNEDFSVSVFSGKVELGQGITTALAQIAAEELGVALERIRLVTADTQCTPDEGGTTGSRSLETSGVAIRLAAAAAREHLLSLAFEQLESLTHARDLRVVDGAITDEQSGRSTDYWELLGGRRFNRLIGSNVSLKAPDSYKVVGRSERASRSLEQGQRRRKLCARYGAARHAARSRGSTTGAIMRVSKTFNCEAVLQLPGVVDVVQDGQFIAVTRRARRAGDLGGGEGAGEYVLEIRSRFAACGADLQRLVEQADASASNR